MEKNKFYTIKEAAKMIGISEQTLRRWDDDGKIHCDRTKGGHRRINWIEMQEIMKLYKPKDEFYCETCHTRIEKKWIETFWYDLVGYPLKICPKCYSNKRKEEYERTLKEYEKNSSDAKIALSYIDQMYKRCDNCSNDFEYPYKRCTVCHAPDHFEIVTLEISAKMLANGKKSIMTNRKDMDNINCDKCKHGIIDINERKCSRFNFDITKMIRNGCFASGDFYVYQINVDTSSVTRCKGFENND